jgi:hypothetical protein
LGSVDLIGHVIIKGWRLFIINNEVC